MRIVEPRVAALACHPWPTVQHKIMRILYRLEHGEKLTSNRLRNFDGDKFCVLGLFIDESGMGKWHGSTYVTDDGHCLEAGLSDSIYKYYGLINKYGAFSYDDLPAEIQEKLAVLNDAYGDAANYLTLSIVNDYISINGKDSVNDILAAIIRSGAIFTDR